MTALGWTSDWAWIDWAGVALAFLGPMPQYRPEPPQPLPGNAWGATIIMVGLVVIMVAPMIAIWGFHRPIETLRAQCEATGGRLVYVALDGPRRCRHPGPHAQAETARD